MREINAPMRNSKLIHVEVVKNDISIKEVTKSMTPNTLFHNMVEY